MEDRRLCYGVYSNFFFKDYTNAKMADTDLQFYKRLIGRLKIPGAYQSKMICNFTGSSGIYSFIEKHIPDKFMLLLRRKRSHCLQPLNSQTSPHPVATNSPFAPPTPYTKCYGLKPNLVRANDYKLYELFQKSLQKNSYY